MGKTMVRSLTCLLYVRIYRVYPSHETTLLTAIVSTLSTSQKSEYKMTLYFKLAI